MDTEKAAIRAEEVIENKKVRSIYFNNAYIIYRGTNERVDCESYIDALYKKNNILSVIGSGDQVLNSILLGCKNIDAYDISMFPKYYLKFKLAAIKELSYEEYLFFFYGENSFDKSKFNRVLNQLDDDTKYFWSYLTRNRSPKELYDSKLFTGWMPTIKDEIFRNPYLSDYHKYYELRNKLNEPTINYIDGNIYEFSKTLDKDYDLINLSNICMYADCEFPYVDVIDAYKKYKSFVKNLRINPDGKILNYIINVERDSSLIISDYVLNNDGFSNNYVRGSLNNRTDSVNIYRKVM
jgi:hypothetical protein